MALPANVPEARVGLFIEEPEHGLYFVSPDNQLAFQRTSELKVAPHMHLYTLHNICMLYKEESRGYVKYVEDEGWNRKLDVSIAPTLEVKQEAVELAEGV